MATKLTPEQLAALGKVSTANGNGGGYYRDAATNTGYIQNHDNWLNGLQANGGEGAEFDNSHTGYQAFKDDGTGGGYEKLIGQQYDKYGLEGDYKSSGVFQDRDPMWKTALTYAAMMATVGAAGGAFAAYGVPGLSGAGAGAAGAGGTGLGTGSGAFLGEGVASGIGAWDTALATAPSWSSAGGFSAGLGGSSGGGGGFGGGAGGASAGGAEVGGSGAFLGEGASSGIPAWDAALANAPAAGSPGLFDSLANALGKKGMGTLSTLAGGLLGSQGERKTATETETMDPRMDPYIYGDQGLLQRTQSLLARQDSPEARAGYEKIRSTGLGLLGQPVAGNGFNRFYPGK